MRFPVPLRLSNLRRIDNRPFAPVSNRREACQAPQTAQVVPGLRIGENEATGMAAFLYEFEWDPVKAKENYSKHGVDFERAAQVFRDPLALTIPDEEHSVSEVRWITLGKDPMGQYLLVVHTFEQLSNDLGEFG